MMTENTTIEDVLRNELTGEQFAAATSDAREVLCLACAGSGKSRTMAYRIAWLVARYDEAPESIIAFTFTEKAADTIRRRVAQALAQVGVDPVIIGRMYIGTIHAFAQHLLGTLDPDYRQYEVLDENRLKLYLMSRYVDLSLSRFRQRDSRGSYFKTMKQIADAWITANEEMLSLDEIREQDEEMGGLLAQIYHRLQEERFFDFSLMLRLAIEKLESSPSVTRQALGEIRHVLIDEYQDINPAQECLIQALHQNFQASIFAVGDDDQAIYEWRGADVFNILHFNRRYPEAELFTLPVNFRSTPQIVSTADYFIHQELGPQRMPKHPRAAYEPILHDFRVLWFETREEEADWVAEQIYSMLGTEYRETDGTIRGLTPGDFAILMRSTRTEEQTGIPRHAPFTRALTRRSIPFSLEAGGSPFDRDMVRVILEAFELLRDAPPTRDTVIRFFEEKITHIYPEADLAQVIRVLGEWGREIHAPYGFGAPRRKLYPQALFHDLLEAFRIDKISVPDEIMREIGVVSKILLDVESVYMSIDSTARFRDVLNYLKNVARYGYDISTDDLTRRPDAVTVSTVHKVKGLEFPCVFVVDVESGRFPGRRRGYQGWLPRAVLASAIERGAYQSTPQGEARLFYTALTRAERFLYVTGAGWLPGGRRARRQSLFAQRLLAHGVSSQPGEGEFPKTRPRRRIEEVDYPTSFSEIKYYLRCPKDYQFRHRYGFNPPVPEMFGYGKTVHAIIERLHTRFQPHPPQPEEVEEIARDTFHLQHVPRSDTGAEGPYERAENAAVRIAQRYAEEYAEDFERLRSVEVAFEIPGSRCVISGSIDLVLWEDPDGEIQKAEIVDFKTMEFPEEESRQEEIEWTELALQVQLYARAAEQLLGQNAKTGHVHFLKNSLRVEVPIDEEAVMHALANIEWAVEGILEGDFPMRPHFQKCATCDFRQICPQMPEEFKRTTLPPDVHISQTQRQQIPAFRLFDPRHRK